MSLVLFHVVITNAEVIRAIRIPVIEEWAKSVLTR